MACALQTLIEELATEKENFWIFFCFILLFAVSCQEEEAKPSVEKVMDYFPLQYGNQWTRAREGIAENAHVSFTDTEWWKVNPDHCLEHYNNVTPAGEDYLGYRALYLHDNLEINDAMGTFISIKYLHPPFDSLLPVASDNYNFLRERWIKGGLVRLKTSFGEFECICTKTTYHIPEDQQDEYLYFCKNIGVYLREI